MHGQVVHIQRAVIADILRDGMQDPDPGVGAVVFRMHNRIAPGRVKGFAYGGRFMVSVREPNVLDFLIILYSELFVCQMGFKHFFRLFLKKVAFELKKEKRKTGFSLDKGG